MNQIAVIRLLRSRTKPEVERQIGRRDAWAPGDLALQVGTQLAMQLDARPAPADLAAIAERWRPWRAVAARLLWSYYALARRRGPVQPI